MLGKSTEHLNQLCTVGPYMAGMNLLNTFAEHLEPGSFPRFRGDRVTGGPQGNSIRKSVVLGTVKELKTRARAMKAAEEHRLNANRESEPEVRTFRALIDRYILEEGLREAKSRSRAIGVIEEDESFDAEALDPSTASSCLSMLDVHIRPKWGGSPISEVKPEKVTQWLRGLDLAPKTKGHIKALMNQLFEKAMLWELIPIGRNPMELVRVKGISKRVKKPLTLDPEQCWSLMGYTHLVTADDVRVAGELGALLDKEFLAQDLPKLPPNEETASELISEAV